MKITSRITAELHNQY